MATTAPRRQIPLLGIPSVRDYGAPAWFERLPRGIGTGGVLLFLLAVSGFIRGHYLSGELWSAEAGTVGVATHSLSAIPGVLRQGGGAPLYPMLLHVWMSIFGSGEVAVHALSLLFGLLTVPLSMWFGWSLWGRRGGYLAAAVFAFNAFLTQYAEEARPYELMCLLGLIATGSFLHAFLGRRRGWLPVFGLSLALLAYTDDWAFFMWGACAVALVPLALAAEDRRTVLRDAALVYLGAVIVYLPWLPTLIHQAAMATAPWHYAPLLGLNFPRQLLGSDRVDAAVALAVLVGLGPLVARPLRRSPEALASGSLALIVAASAVAALIASLFVPAWVARYFAPVVPALLLLIALASTRSGILGLAVVVVTCAFLANAASFIPTYKSDMRDLSGEMAPRLHPRDVVLVGQPEQVPLASYYLPAGLRYVTELGADPHPGYMNWDDAYRRLRRSDPRTLVGQLVRGLAPGTQVLWLQPLTEGARNWSQPWTELVRRRAAQTDAALISNPDLRQVPGVFGPHNYRGSCCTAMSAVLFVKR